MALFQASIFSESSYKSDQPVRTKFKLTNHSQESMRVLKWFTPLEGLRSDCLKVIRNGQRVSYDGPLAKRGTPAETDYVTLASGASIETEVAVHEAYQVSEPGTYNVSADTDVHAVALPEFNLFAARDLNPREAAAALFRRSLRQPIPEAATNFVVEDSGSRIMTAGERARGTQVQLTATTAKLKTTTVAGTALDPKFKGGDRARQAAAKKAHFDGYRLVQAALGSLKNDARYAEWFGIHSQARFQAVHDHYSKIASDMEQKVFTYDLTGHGCESGDYAYTYKHTTTIWTCSEFWSAPATGKDSKAGTIVHEHSHASSGTDDLAYGETNCRQLAINDPDKAVRNADSHEFYAKG